METYYLTAEECAFFKERLAEMEAAKAECERLGREIVGAVRTLADTHGMPEEVSLNTSNGTLRRKYPDAVTRDLARMLQ